ncbi:putative cardiolipin synthase [Lysobacter niastensis]|uniref:Cardiolipin synthase n=1 Tax=Lysobacter niastensis TaxID=380629 RepID=A0ABU1W6X3_9GAMM|nr:phospholipase D family protein [Lysobacter niastensis]MDR7133224.1 putative cardiolipin synthase [Lysobacter niastensis]
MATVSASSRLHLLLLSAVLALLAASGCARLPPRGELPPEHALPVAHDAALDRAFLPRLEQHPGESGFRLVSDGVEAFALRGLSARYAERSLDVQYYIWHDDLTGWMLARELVRAADRGVRVRLLLDDMDARAHNFALAGLDAHPNIEVRLFNPFASRRGTASKLAEGMTAFSRINHRMHNKAWIADNRIAITGGRNVGDEYFAASEQINFVDTDYAVLGPAVAQLSDAFDRYWNSTAVYPVAVLSPELVTPQTLDKLRAGDADRRRQVAESAWAQSLADNAAVRRIQSGELDVHWTPRWQVLADDPLKALKAPDPKARSEVLRGFGQAMRDSTSTITLISPYFVPGDAGTTSLVDAVTDGRRVRIITNSLAANDVAAVHGGYSKYRERLVDGGVSLWELKPASGPGADKSLFGSSGASLHTKAAIMDAQTVFVGSFNLDPRSVSLNCEQGVLATHPALAEELGVIFERMTDGDRAWRVDRDAKGRLQWRDGVRTEHRDPDASLSRRITARLLRWLPLDSQL